MVAEEFHVLTFSSAQHFWPWKSRHGVMEYDNLANSLMPTRATSFSSIIPDPGKEYNVRMH